ncbi:MAG: glycosyltransferase involved in cell wall biosynthesis [Patiriisocius sp.]|jgi:glycosyltransferase involved in cell wall biosynthesis
MNKKISIITPTLNQGSFIEECILSVLNQNYDNLEFIVIDGGSDDGTLNILEKYKKHFSYYISEPDKGQSDAINKGLKLATGEIINWLNSDDYLEPGSLQMINSAFQDNSVNIFSGRSNIIRDGHVTKHSSGLDVYENNLAKTIAWARIDQPETYWRKTVIDEIGSLNNVLHYIMDRDWWVKYLFKYDLEGILQSDKIITNFRLHEDSKTVSSTDDFNVERNKYFAGIIKNSKIEFPLNLVGDITLESILDLPHSTNDQLTHGIANYFFMLLATEKYEESNFKLFRGLYNQINKDFLAKEDALHLNKLYSRSNILPEGFHRIIKRIRA